MIRLPSRYEDLEEAFRGRLLPNSDLLSLVKRAYASMIVSGGIRFLPIYGESGCGKSCATLELGSHLPECGATKLPLEAVVNRPLLEDFVSREQARLGMQKLVVPIIDQYEEQVAQRTAIPLQFVEHLSLLDRGPFRQLPTLFIWLTTSQEFQQSLVRSTRRNRRIVVQDDFELQGPPKEQWPNIMEETFQFHNAGKPLAEYEILPRDLGEASIECATLGAAIETIGQKIASFNENLRDLSEYLVVMLWPVTDAHRSIRVSSFTDARNGYQLDWNTWYRELSRDDRARLPLHALNRARLYFDLRLVPIPVANLHRLCLDLDNEDFTLGASYVAEFKNTHFFSILKDSWNPERFSSLRLRESRRAKDAKDWYESITREPTKLGRRVAKILRNLGLSARYEESITSPHSTVRADVFVDRPQSPKNKVIIELKAFSSQNTHPSSIRDAIRTTLRRHARFAGFLDVH